MPLEPNQFHKHLFIRTFFKIHFTEFVALYKQLNGSLELDGKKWHQFVNSKELFDMIYPSMQQISHFTLEAIAYCEPVEFLGDEIRTEDFQTYHAIPQVQHDNLKTPDQLLGTIQHATTCFITMVCHMFFKHLYKKQFMILREVNGMGTSWVYLNNELEYCLQEDEGVS